MLLETMLAMEETPATQAQHKVEDAKLRDQVAQAKEALKKQLAEPPVLAAPVEKEPLLLYVASNSRVIATS